MARRVLAVATVGALAFVVAVGSAVADDKDEKKKGDKKDEKPATIKEIMVKGHKGAKALITGVGAHVKAGEWKDAEDGAKTLKFFGESLGKNKPKKGDDDSWKKLSDEYKESTAAVATAVEKKDEKAAKESLTKITKSCKGCHDAHR